jgi:hypothetical protein
MYNQKGILNANLFEVLDEKCEGELMGLAVEWGRCVEIGMKMSRLGLNRTGSVHSLLILLRCLGELIF